MKIEYKFVNGETVNIEVYGNFEEIMLELKHELENHNRKETRRHGSMEEFDDKSDVWKDKDCESTEDQIFKNFDKDKLYTAISKLKPQEQELLHMLYLNKNPISQVELAKTQNVSVGSIKMKLQRIKTKLNKYL